MMDQKYLDEIRARERAATPGPWVYENELLDVSGYLSFSLEPLSENDSQFIAHVRQDTPALLEEVERLLSALEAKEAINRAYSATLDMKQSEVERLRAERDHYEKALESIRKNSDFVRYLAENALQELRGPQSEEEE